MAVFNIGDMVTEIHQSIGNESTKNKQKKNRKKISGTLSFRPPKLGLGHPLGIPLGLFCGIMVGRSKTRKWSGNNMTNDPNKKYI